MTALKSYIECYLNNNENIDEFGLWAFGKSYRDLKDAIIFLDAWNKLHGDKLNLHPGGNISKDIGKMIDLWRDSKSD